MCVRLYFLYSKVMEKRDIRRGVYFRILRYVTFERPRTLTPSSECECEDCPA